MKKQFYSAPVLEQLRMESEMPVMVGSSVPVAKSNIAAMTVGSTGNW